jgi:hypothetical protein
MRWPAAMFLAAACAVGCHSTPSTFDPFLPNRRIAAPGTGAASGTPDAYYNPATPYPGAAPTYPAPPAGAAGGFNGSYPPPGGYPSQGSPTPVPVNGGFGTVPGPGQSSQVLPSSPGSGGAPQTSTPRSQVTRAGYVTTADNEPSAVYQKRRAATPTTAASDTGSSQTIDIMDLPPVLASR